MENETLLRKAEFNEKVLTYWLLSGALVLFFTIVGIPLLLLWFPLGRVLCRKYLSYISCELTEKNLQIRKGWLNRIEKTIPLEKITDLAMFQGPIMRAMDLKGFKVETAGSSGSAGASYLVNMIGIVDTDGFRDAVLAQRDVLGERGAGTPAAPPPQPAEHGANEHLRVLRDILHTLVRIETKLDDPTRGG